MADVIILELDADPDLYDKVNEELGLDPASGSGESMSPKGHHTG